MNEIRFFLKRPKADKATAIILDYSATDGRFKYYTGESILPLDWNAGHPADVGISAILNRIVATIRELSVDCKVKGVPMTKGRIGARLDIVLDKRTVGGTDTVYAAFDEAIAGMRNGTIVTPKGERYSNGTIKTTEHHASLLKAFCPTMRFSDIDIAMYNRFIAWCHKKDYARNYTGTIIKNWKTLLRVTRGKYHDNPIYEAKEFKRLQEDATDIYLTDREIKLLARQKVTARQDVARDWFVLGCYLGLRVNDLISLNKKNLQKGFVTVVSEKTDARVVIPIHPEAGKILKKWKGFPPRITDVELNRTIKEVAKSADMTDQVIHSVTKGGRRQDTYLMKWEMISSHTMRRSAITNLLKAKVPIDIVMKLVGIASFGTIKKYNKMTAEDAGKIAAGLDYFKG